MGDYKALKPCSFDKEYGIGDMIPEESVDPSRVNALKSMGLIAEMEATGPVTDDERAAFEEKKAALAADRETFEKVKAEFEEQAQLSILPGGEGEEPSDSPEGEGEDETPDSPEGEEATSKSALERMNKADLLIMAKEKDLPADDTMTKAQLAEAILAV
ncbi:MAG: hypothetical protein VB031_02190 [Eubacteriaceae bacterium]|nr:hypothetical protein [Eubacteriaceae bacterium]